MKKFSEALLLCASILLAACGSDSGDNGGGGSTTLPTYTPNRTLAFPGADGGARVTKGGAEGDVYIVTNLNDSGEGSLRYGLTKGNRTIVFAVGGQINLSSKLSIDVENVTIAGQTAPGDGITIAGYPVYLSIKAKNVILRFLRFRMGDQNGGKGNFDPEDGDALGGKDCLNLMVDHCSISWSTDECASFSRVNGLTMQYCIISESLRKSVHVKGNHGYGGIWGGKNASYHHNLLAHHDSRNPRFDHNYVGHNIYGPIDYVNNVVYNWGGNSAYGGEAGTADNVFHINMINNYNKPGPSTTKHPNRLLELTSTCSYCYNWAESNGKSVRTATNESYVGRYYISGNYVNGTANKDWNGVDATADTRSVSDLLAQAKMTSQYTSGLYKLNFTETAEEAYNSVLAYAGASKVLDAVDKRILKDVKEGTGSLIDTTPEYPTLSSGTPITDSDQDGMPDNWEQEQLSAIGASGVSISDFKPNAYNLSAKYTNLEVYMNSLVSGCFPAGANAGAIK